jgi:hypothetical protein
MTLREMAIGMWTSANRGDPVKTDPDEACWYARRPARGHGAATALQPGSITGTAGFLPASPAQPDSSPLRY